MRGEARIKRAVLGATGNFENNGGAIEFAFIDGFSPLTGQTFSFFDVGGSFANAGTFAVTGLEPGWDFATDYNPATGGFSLTSLSDGITAIPEPGTYVLLAGAAALGFAVWRRRGSEAARGTSRGNRRAR